MPRPSASRLSSASCALLAAALASCAGAKVPEPLGACGTEAPKASASALPLPAPPVTILSTADPKFLETYAQTRAFRLGTPRNVAISPDDGAVLFLRSAARDPKQALYETDLTTGLTRELLAPEKLLGVEGEKLSPEEKARRERLRITASGFTAFELSEDGKQILLPLSGRIFVVDRKTGARVEAKTGKGSAFDPHLSPDGKEVAFVRDGDLWVIGLDDKAKETRVTIGSNDDVTHGLADFVAQEELDRTRGFWWSPDGDKLLYEEVDSKKVERFTIADPAHPEKAPDRAPYPRAGKTNAEVRFGLVSKKGGKTTWVDWDRAKFPYVAQVTFKAGLFALHVLDRAQRTGALLGVDPKTGATTVLVEEKDDAWINVDPSVPRVLADGTFLWSSEQSGAPQLELHDKNGKLLRTLSSPGYRALVGVDPKARIAYFAGATEPTQRGLFATPLAGGEAKAVPLDDATFATPVMGPTGTVVAGYEGDRAGHRAWNARSVDGKRKIALPAVAEHPAIRPIQFLAVGDDALRVSVLLPVGFQKGKKYPVVDAAYGGPHHQQVTDDGASYARDQWLADATSAIVVRIDAKGTPGRGRAFERAVKDAFAKVPLDGHVAALQALGKLMPELDLDRVGVYGWSFGGYFAALAVLARPDFYKVGMAGAPVTDWRDYDTAYTERYLGMPDAQAHVYDMNAVTTYAAQPSTHRPLLVVHGTADDNVYFVHGLKLVEALAKAGRPFQFLPVTGMTHQIASPAHNELVWQRAAEHLRKL